MKKLLISVLFISFLLAGCTGKEDTQRADSTVDIDASGEAIKAKRVSVPVEEVVEPEEPVPAPVEETVEPEESIPEPVEEVAEPEKAEIPESDRGTNTYSTFVPKVVTFEMSDNILTIVTDDGSRFGWSDGNEGFSISYPVAEDCIWETGYFAADFVAEDTT